ncbi:MAG: hypothetical protein LH468_13095 [Nocardioides sp.]|nr:hypothetical protein [Nocardioides sp.]
MHTTTQIEVTDWEELRRLPGAMQTLCGQAEEMVRHARAWVCSTEGFEPSPMCVLRPLVPVMHQLEDVFTRLGDELSQEWARLQLGVEQARAELEAADAAVTRGLGPGIGALR